MVPSYVTKLNASLKLQLPKRYQKNTFKTRFAVKA